MIAGPDKSSNMLLPRSVRRALDAMHANVGHSRAVAELAAVAGVSSRTLQRQFLAFLGKTPRAMLRDIGFERARRELLQGSPGAKVMDVALRAGFAHCGRFSLEYRRRYDETPSETLKRQAVFVAALTSMPSSLVSSRDWPTVAFGRIEAASGTSRDRGQYCRRPCLRADARRDFRRNTTEIGALSTDRRDPGIGDADAPDLSINRQRNRPSDLGAPLRQRSRRCRCRGASRHQNCRGSSAIPAPCGDRSRAAKTLCRPQFARPRAQGHAGRALARRRGKCARARNAGSGDGTGPQPRTRDRARGLGPHSARGLSFYRRAAAGARAEHRTGAEGAGTFR